MRRAPRGKGTHADNKRRAGTATRGRAQRRRPRSRAVVSPRCPPFRLQHVFFFFNDTATTEIYTLSLHDALPIYDLDSRTNAQTGHLRQSLEGVLMPLEQFGGLSVQFRNLVFQ